MKQCLKPRRNNMMSMLSTIWESSKIKHPTTESKEGMIYTEHSCCCSAWRQPPVILLIGSWHMAWYHHHPVHLTSTLSCPGLSYKQTLVPSLSCVCDKYLILTWPLLQAHSGTITIWQVPYLAMATPTSPLWKNTLSLDLRHALGFLVPVKVQEIWEAALLMPHTSANTATGSCMQTWWLQQAPFPNSSSSECYSCDLHCKM